MHSVLQEPGQSVVGFPGDSVAKNPPASAVDAGDKGLIPHQG